MKKIVCVLSLLVLFQQNCLAFKVYSYDEEGNRVYRTITPEEFSKYKKQKRRSFVRVPRTNWEISDAMRANKHPYYYKGKY